MVHWSLIHTVRDTETTFAQIVADSMNWDCPMDDVECNTTVTQKMYHFGMGTYGSRSIAVCGSAIL